MISQDITYTDYEGKEVTKTFWFHLTRLDAAEVNLHDDLEEIMNAGDAIRSMKALKRLVRAGIRERVGQRVIQPEHLGDEFVSSDAYSAWVFDLLKDDDGGVARMKKFIAGMAPHIVGAEPQDRLPLDTKKEK